MSLRCYFCLTTIEVDPDKNADFVVQNDSPVRAFTALVATLRPLWPRRCDRHPA
jgi:hypothetical protein